MTRDNQGLSSRLTIKIDGPYFPLDKFKKVLESFSIVLEEIDKEISEDKEKGLEWSIASIEQGSIIVTAEGNRISDEIEIQRPSLVINTFKVGLETIQKSAYHPQGFTKRALRNLKTFSQIQDPDDFSEIVFSTEDWRLQVTPKLAINIEELKPEIYKSYGSIEGYLVSMSLVKKSSIGIRSFTDNKVIRCYFSDDLFEQAKEAIGKKVYVFGIIRQYFHGEKRNIEVKKLKILPQQSQASSLDNILKLMRGETVE